MKYVILLLLALLGFICAFLIFSKIKRSSGRVIVLNGPSGAGKSSI